MLLNLKSKYILYLMLSLVLIYFSQGILYPTGTIVSQIAYVLIIIISIFYFLFYLQQFRRCSFFIKIWIFFLLLNIVYFCIDLNLVYLDSFKMVLLNMLPLFCFYYFSQRQLLRRQDLIVFFLILFPLICYKFATARTELQDFKNDERVVENTVYLIVGVLPFIFIIKHRGLSMIFLFVTLLFIVQSGKRAAFLAGVITLILFLIYQLNFLKGKNKRFLDVGYILTFLIALGTWGVSFFMDNDFLIYRLELMFSGDSAGRDDLYQEVIRSWYSIDSVTNYLLGGGFSSSQKITKMGSHNDWTEVTASFGALGFLLYFLLFLSMVVVVLKKQLVSNNLVSFVTLISIGLLVSLTSRWYWSSFAFTQFLLLPYLLATGEKNNSNQIKLK